MLRRSLLIVAAGVVIATSCQRADNPTAPQLPRVPPSVGANVTVRPLHVEGGCWVLDVAGTMYQPMNLSAEYRVDGQPVRALFYETPDLRSVCMVGPQLNCSASDRLLHSG